MGEGMSTANYCAIIPVYNHEQMLPQTVEATLAYLPVILIDDGSRPECHAVMQDLAERYSDVTLVTRTHNGGKGAAVKTGLRAAAEKGYSHALQIDADGQHNTDDIPRFIARSQQQPQTLIAGRPQYDDSVPRARLYGRYATHIWVWINTLSLTIKDSMCGFRVYPLTQSVALLDRSHIGDRMDFDTEFIVRWYWCGYPIEQLLTAVTYPEHGVSHFLAWRDNKLISLMHARLFFGMLWRSPQLLWRRLIT